ncbi:Inner membrane metabolite transport protein YhjE [Rhodococcus erythropolis]|uniref:MFS transporter n=1 Tax=Rhodococcus erythropolis TaxID=1833 RepID=UPI000BB3E536|nr:MFS transporter [Rhodococcus erythropolis]PBI91951.1 Inner membrane metabolite transport protein YhjE [Rhodococcus erythropolis]
MVTRDNQPSEVGISRIAGASLVGTTIEFFDFFIFGTASALIFNKVFFPALDPLVGTLAAFATFGVAFAARPIGALLFGHFGDRLGRKTMLVTSLLLMGVGTAFVGLLPTYAQVGILAPVLLVLCRLTQGLALGGEWGGAVLMAIEHAPPRRRAFYGSWPQMGVPLGLVLATAMFWLVQKLPEDQLMSWGWRVPFLASGLMVAVGLYIRLKIEDSPAFKAVQSEGKQERFPAITVIRTAGRGVIIGAMATAAGNVPFYLVTVYSLKWGSDNGLDRGTLLMAICAASVAQAITIPIVAVYCDRLGRRPVLLVGCIVTMSEAFPFFWLIQNGSTPAIYLAMFLALPLGSAMVYAPLAVFLPEIFPTQLRYSGSGMAYTLGALLFSAPVPFLAAALVDRFDATWPLALCIVIAATISFIGVALARESRDDDINWSTKVGSSDTNGASGASKIEAAS